MSLRVKAAALTAAVCVVGGLVVCDNGRSKPKAAALASISNSGKAWFSMAVVQGKSVLYSPEVLFVHADVTLVEAAPLTSSGAEILDVRLTRLRNASGVVGPEGSGHPGGGCFDGWPPKGFGRTYPARGAALRSGEMVSLTVYLRPVRTGILDFHGVRARYRMQDGTLEEQRFEHSTDLRLEVVPDEQSLPDPNDPNLLPTCFEPPPEWLKP